VDASDEITTCFTQSVGSVASSRVDSSKWSNSTYLKKRFDLLSQKSVQELDVINLGHKVPVVFPIDILESKCLQHLRIGFFTMILDLLCFNYNSLQTRVLFLHSGREQVILGVN
jgi:hypothetical protein